MATKSRTSRTGLSELVHLNSGLRRAATLHQAQSVPTLGHAGQRQRRCLCRPRSKHRAAPALQVVLGPCAFARVLHRAISWCSRRQRCRRCMPRGRFSPRHLGPRVAAGARRRVRAPAFASCGKLRAASRADCARRPSACPSNLRAFAQQDCACATVRTSRHRHGRSRESRGRTSQNSGLRPQS